MSLLVIFDTASFLPGRQLIARPRLMEKADRGGLSASDRRISAGWRGGRRYNAAPNQKWQGDPSR
jgi:hypothetical protein